MYWIGPVAQIENPELIRSLGSRRMREFSVRILMGWAEITVGPFGGRRLQRTEVCASRPSQYKSCGFPGTFLI